MTKIKPHKQLTAVMMIALLLIQVSLDLFGCTGTGGSIWFGSSSGVNEVTLAVAAGFC